MPCRNTSFVGRSTSEDSGFTLTELLVVVVILGVLVAIAIPLYLRFTQNAYLVSVKADIHTMQLEEQNYAGNEANTGYASTNQLISANPNLKLSPGSVAAIVWSSDTGYCVGATNTKGPGTRPRPSPRSGTPTRATSTTRGSAP